MNTIKVENFHKNFSNVQAVKGVDFSVEKGELFGIIGPDGAGKTTLIRAICTLLLPDSGRILVEDFDTVQDISEIRSILGYMPQRFSLYQDLTVAQNLIFFADLFQVPAQERESRLTQLYQFSKLEPFQHRLAGALSGGMKQKLALSCALVHTPDILILDEPTFGVDPVSRQEFWEILRETQKQGTTILVSTALMDEADQCQRVALFYEGKIAAIGSPESLKQDYQHPLFKLQSDDLRKTRQFFSDMPEAVATQLFGDALHVSFREAPAADQWRKWEADRELGIRSWKEASPSIEDVFLDLMGDNR